MYSRPMDPYAAYLCGPLADGRTVGRHEVVLVVAADQTRAVFKAQVKWRGALSEPLEALNCIDVVDVCTITPTGRPERDDDVEMETVN